MVVVVCMSVSRWDTLLSLSHLRRRKIDELKKEITTNRKFKPKQSYFLILISVLCIIHIS